ncbi:YDG domain-containing protein [Brumimicrobium mesophilum]|uniref:YDG domain-containing protein n=1 Tax=Brumimicrobium mesophilum TaxID=392717 RepID=UPI000D1436FA|nr:YDG domain-containing protein [Brumimicrobium mesophilum]
MFKNVFRKKLIPVVLVILTFLFSGISNVWGQNTIFDEDGSGALPIGWVGVNNNSSQPIVKGTYYLVEADDPSDIITTAAYDLSAYGSATFELDVASYGSGSYNPAKIEISYDGGSTYLETYTSTVTTGSSYIYGGSFTLSSVSSQVVLRITNNGTSGRGVRLRDLILEATAPVGPTLSTTSTSLSDLNYVVGNGPSTVQSFDLSGTNLDGSDVELATIINDCEISLSSNSGFGHYIDLGAYDGTSTTIYVRLKAGLVVDSYIDQVLITGGGVPAAGEIDYDLSGEVWLTAPPLVYCTPTYSSGSATSDWISNVTLNSLNHTSPKTTGPEYYIFYDSETVPDLTLGNNEDVTVTVASESNQYIAVWIDFNQNGTFEPSEGLVSGNVGTSGNNSLNATLSFSVPLNAVLGNTRMRIRGGDDYPISISEACDATSSNWGETKDYIVNVVSASPTLSVSPTSLSGLDYTFGSGPSTVQTFTLTGNNLDGINSVELLLGGTDFVISSDNVTFSDYLDLGTNTSISQTIYVRLESGLPVANYTDQIYISGGGVPTAGEIDFDLSGDVDAVIPPSITSSLAESLVYGSTVSYQITATENPTSFDASGLPAGLSVNTATGEISGTVTQDVGTVNSTIEATNSGGTDTETLVWTITPKPLTATGLSADDKVYDATDVASITGSATLNGIVGLDDVGITTPSGQFDDKNVGTGKTVTIATNVLTGADAGNYTLTQPTLTADVTPFGLTVSGAVADGKVYDGTTDATISGASLVGIIASDVVTLTSTGTFADPNAATGIAVTSTMTLGGADGGNYTLTQPTGLSADITPATQTITFAAISDKVLSSGSFTVSATSSSGLPVTFTGTTPTITVTGTNVDLNSLGAASITASVAASGNYAAAVDVVQGFNVINGPCVEEDFSNMGSISAYSNTNWPGAGGNWSVTVGRSDQDINGSDAICFRGTVTSPSLPGGIESITLTTERKFSGGSGNLTIEVNGNSVGTIPYDDFVQTNTISGLNITGAVIIEIVNESSDRVAIDDVQIFCPPVGPEIDILGNSTSIISGSNSPNLIDHTDFGQVAVAGGTFTRTFTIENTGGADLNLTGTGPTFVSFTGANAADFSITANPTTPIAQAGSTTFTVEFDPSATGVRTAILSIDNDDADEDPYYFTIQGTGVNSANSDIIASVGFPYSSDIPYQNFQGNPVTTTGNGVGSFGFIVRDGGGAIDTDLLGTELTDISFTTANISNVRSAALFGSGGFIANASSIGAGEIAFSGLSGASVTAADGTDLNLFLYVSFNSTVIDNDQMQYTVSSATAASSGSVFAAANAGGAFSPTTGDINRLEVTATELSFEQQPTTTSINGTMTPSPQVAAVDANGSIDLDFVGSISIASSTGNMTGGPLSETAVAGVATFGSVVHTVAETGLDLLATSVPLTSATSTLFDITTIVYLNGDYRTISSGTWGTTNGSNATWEEYSGGTWSASSAPNTNTNANIYIRNGHTVTTNGSFGTNVNVKIQDGGELVIEHTSTASSMYVYEGGLLTVNANFQVNNDFDVEDNARVTLNYDFGNPSTSIWRGTENFRPHSQLYIYDWNDDEPLYDGNVTSNDHAGYDAVFGNVYIDLSLGNNDLDGNWNLLGENSGTFNLTHGDFVFESSPGEHIRFYAETGTTINPTIHGNLNVLDSWSLSDRIAVGSAGGINLTIDGDLNIDSECEFSVRQANNASSPVNLTVNGDILLNGSNVTSSTKFYINYNIYTNSVAAQGSVNLRGNLLVSSDVEILNRGPYDDAFFNFDGPGTIQQVDVGSVIADNSNSKGLPFFVKGGAYVQLLNNDLQLAENSSVEVEAEGTLDFSFNGTTPLNVVDGGNNTSVFRSYPSSILKITSPQGIVSAGASGNVRTTTRTFEDLADFHYVGLETQNTGNALPSSIRKLYINNTGATGNNYVIISNGQKNVHDTLFMVQGNVGSSASNLLSIGASVGETGILDYSSGYVIGALRRWFNGTSSGDAEGLFPIGFEAFGLKNRHAKVEFTSAPSAGGYLDVVFANGAMGFAGLPIAAANTGGATFDVISAEDQGFWQIDNLASTLDDGDYTISLTGEGFNVINSLSELTLLKRVVANGPNWFAPGTHIAPSGSVGTPTVSRSGMSGWSNFGFGGGINNPLPIELTAFEVTCDEESQAVNINWTTGSELNSSHFILEKSRDAKNWNEVAEVNAAGNSNSEINYREIDSNPWNGITYYRLRQFDFNGDMQEFDPISTSCTTGESAAMVYPNPSNGDFTVEVNWSGNSVNTPIHILDLTGKVVLQQEVNLKEGVKQVHFNQKDLQAGTYLIVFTNTDLKPIRMIITN